MAVAPDKPRRRTGAGGAPAGTDRTRRNGTVEVKKQAKREEERLKRSLTPATGEVPKKEEKKEEEEPQSKAKETSKGYRWVALTGDPANQAARESLFEALRRKVSVLQDTVTLMNDMRTQMESMREEMNRMRTELERMPRNETR